MAIADDKKVYKALIVDDCDDDRYFLRVTLRRSGRFKVMGECRDGEDAIAYLNGDSPYSNRTQFPLPDLMLLDLKMPRMDGFGVLRWLAAHPFSHLTVIIRSDSFLEQDRALSLSLGAHGFWVKTAQREKQDELLKEILGLLDQKDFPKPRINDEPRRTP